MLPDNAQELQKCWGDCLISNEVSECADILAVYQYMSATIHELSLMSDSLCSMSTGYGMTGSWAMDMGWTVLASTSARYVVSVMT